jgi:hypothetical protein
MWKVYLAYAFLASLADKITTALCLSRGFVELNPLALNPIFPLFQATTVFSLMCFFGFLSQRFCINLKGVGKKIPVAIVAAPPLYATIHNLVLLLS